MSTIYDVVTLTVNVGATGDALAKIREAAPAGGATLLGVWFSDIGTLGKIMILRSFESADAQVAARKQMLLEGNPFGTAGLITDVTTDSYAPFPFLPPIATGEFGAVYEMRVYGIKLAGLQPTIDAWEKAIPERIKASPLVGAMYALDGASPRFLNIWPYASLNDRSRIRGETVKQGIWPPKGGPANLTTMESTIYMPAPFSPLR